VSMKKLLEMNGKICPCGKEHSFSLEIVSGSNALARLPELVKKLGGSKAFVLSDQNTDLAAGNRVRELLNEADIPFASHSYPEELVEPDEKAVGAAVMYMSAESDVIVAVGSGVINDIGKILSALSGKPYIIVATAPSMDGYASATSSMNRSSLKISLPSRAADVIIGDTEILCNAPLKLLRSGLGDMVAKYVSICEWRIAHLLLDEYYCEEIADLVRSALKQCVDRAEGLLNREPDAVMAVFEGLIVCGLAMNYAGVSRPASGGEHYLSHVIDMRAVEYGYRAELHGLQCAVGTAVMVGLYEKIKKITPDREKALAYVAGFDVEIWNRTLRSFVGKAAESMIALEKREKKYDPFSHKERLEKIIANWDAILRIIDEELPGYAELEAMLDKIGVPKTLNDIGVDEALLPTIFQCTKDMRDKYVLARLAWDLGILEELV